MSNDVVAPTVESLAARVLDELVGPDSDSPDPVERHRLLAKAGEVLAAAQRQLVDRKAGCAAELADAYRMSHTEVAHLLGLGSRQRAQQVIARARTRPPR